MISGRSLAVVGGPGHGTRLHSLPGYYGYFTALWCLLPALAMAAASAERIFDILDAESEVADVPGAKPLPPVSGQVTFENVSFSYFGRHQVLNGRNHRPQPGQAESRGHGHDNHGDS